MGPNPFPAPMLVSCAPRQLGSFGDGKRHTFWVALAVTFGFHALIALVLGLGLLHVRQREPEPVPLEIEFFLAALPPPAASPPPPSLRAGTKPPPPPPIPTLPTPVVPVTTASAELPPPSPINPEPVVPVVPPVVVPDVPHPPQLTPTAKAEPMPPPVTIPVAPVEQVAPMFDVAYLHNPKPEYPAIAKRLRLRGTVVLAVTVDPAGIPTGIEVATSSGASVLDDAAQRSVRDWRFVPARRGSVPVAGTVLVPIRFDEAR